jgi:hypothetical protein
VTSSLFLLGLQAAEGQSVRDGSHDFDFAVGEWHTHVTRILDPFSGGTQSVTLDGTKTARPIWSGRGWLEEIEANGPGGHWEGATLLTYSPETGQWSQTYFDSENGVQPPSIGSFNGGRGEFYSTAVFHGRTVLERGVWSDVTADSHRYEIFLSQDGGRSWALRFKADLTRLKSKVRH